MKLETFKQQTTEVFIEGNGITVSAYPWGNLEGASFLVHGKGEGLPLRFAASLRWEEMDVLLVALNAVRSA